MPYYAVKAGRKPGIYPTWEACKAQTQGFPNAVFKKFPTKAGAEAFVRGEDAAESGAGRSAGRGPAPSKGGAAAAGEAAGERVTGKDLAAGEAVAYVDGSYNAKTRAFGYGVVFLTADGKETFFGKGEGDGSRHRNVAGEVAGAEKAMEIALERGLGQLTICHDYAGIRHWALGEWKANVPLTRQYQARAKEAQTRVSLRFVKVAAHTGVEYNEEADQLAKKGAGLAK